MKRNDKARALVLGALRLHEAGDYEASAAMCRDAVSLDRASADAWHLLAVCRFTQRQWAEAADAADRAARLRPDVAAYALTTGNIAFGAGDWDKAARAYEKAAKLDDTLADAPLGQARALVMMARPEAALGLFERAFQLDPEENLDRKEGVECYATVAPDSLTPAWRQELRRYFARPGPHRWSQARAALAGLRALPEFRQARANAAGIAVLADLATEPLLGILLRENVIVDPEVELLLVDWRRRLLEDPALRAAMPSAFLCDFAIQSFNNEFAFACTVDEEESALALARAASFDEDGARAVAVAAMYLPLSRLPAESMAIARGRMELQALVSATVDPIQEERALQATIPSMGSIEDVVSKSVREQYEVNPYPRLASLDLPPPMPVREWLATELPGLEDGDMFPECPEVLVAGCGTGAVAIALAHRIPSAKVTALDLSLASLAHGKRIAESMRLQNLAFLHGDILSLGGWDKTFDLIHCTGVLHHMADPEAGARALCTRLRPDALILLGLYSARARRTVNAARRVISARGLEATTEGMRALRAEILSAGKGGPLWELTANRDFYSLSGCRDLIFHVQEHQYDLPEIGRMIERLGLRIINLASHAPGAAIAAFRKVFPESDDYADLAKWDQAEELDPGIFEGMVQFWCKSQAPGPPTSRT